MKKRQDELKRLELLRKQAKKSPTVSNLTKKELNHHKRKQMEKIQELQETSQMNSFAKQNQSLVQEEDIRLEPAFE